MNATTYAAARARLASLMDRVCDDHAPVAITRTNGRPVVMVSQEDYDALIARIAPKEPHP